jgi:hypothetical protein
MQSKNTRKSQKKIFAIASVLDKEMSWNKLNQKLQQIENLILESPDDLYQPINHLLRGGKHGIDSIFNCLKTE